MRITFALLLGISISLTTALTKVEEKPTAETKLPSITTTTTQPQLQVSNMTKSTKDTETKKTTRSSKSLKLLNDNRGKRTLYGFGNAGYLYSNVASRRAGYVNEAPENYFPQTGVFNGQQAIAHYPGGYNSHYAHYPQYLEAPEPIIEIIIKDSNETLPTEAPQPIVTKKKKEKVHVFYVNYKKDHNNKLHLESPIASLNNDDITEEEEEIVHIPQPVTPLPALRSTTLRTIIHPDSEKYHSNSGIHVTFGTDDKRQTGHILEENNAESIQRQVVALPAGSNPNALNGLKTEEFAPPSQSHSPNVNQLFESPFQRVHYYQTTQQLPAQHSTHFFRSQGSLHNNQQTSVPTTQPQTQSHVPPQFIQKLPLPQQPSVKFSSPQAPFLPQPQALYRNTPTTQQKIQQYQYQQSQPQLQSQTPPQHQQQPSQQQTAQYYSNYNQHFQHHSNFYQPLSHKATQPPKSTFVFPTVSQKTQELPTRQTSAPYHPIKFRPTPAPLPQIKPVPIPTRLENINFQTQQTTQHYKTQTLNQKSPPQYQQKNPTSSSNPYYFNRQPQFVRQPSFMLPSPTIPSYYKTQSSQTPNQYNNQKATQGTSTLNHFQTQSNNQQQNSAQDQNYASVSFNQQTPQQQLQDPSLISTTIPSAATRVISNNQQQHSSSLSSIHNYFDIQPSKETELLKSIPKFEQHITETIHHPVPPQAQPQLQQQQPQHGVYTNYAFSNRNQVIHDIPAPNLGPTPSPLNQQQATPVSGHYITASNLNSEAAQKQSYNNFVSSLPSSTAAPQFADSTDGQKIMIVTPMPPIIYNQYHSSQYSNQATLQNNIQIQQSHSQQSQSQQSQQHQPYETQSQTANNYFQQPRQSQTTVQATPANQSSQINSQFSVSTYHSDVFRELERRKQQQQNEQKQTNPQTQTYQTDNPQQHQQHQQLKASNQQTDGQNTYIPSNQASVQSGSSLQTPVTSNAKTPQSLLQLPDEVPDDLRQQLLSSGILNNADISVLDYDKVGAVNLENLPAEHLQHFYGAGGSAQISESHKVLTVVKPNGEQVLLSEKELERVKTSNLVPKKQNLDVKVVRFGANNQKSVTDKYLKAAEATIVPPVDLADKQYNRYLPLKINGAQFPIPDTEELKGKKIVSVVVLAPVENDSSGEKRTARSDENKEVKFISGDLIKTLVKKPTTENFKRWLEKEARVNIEQQSLVLLVAKSSDTAEPEIYMYDITTGVVNKLNGELSSKFVSVAEENASSEDLEHASTLDPGALEKMMQPSTSHR